MTNSPTANDGSRMKIVCLFDIDGTLLSSGGAGKAAFEVALKREFRLSELIDQVPMSGRTDRAIIGDLFQLHDIPNTVENWHRFQAVYLECLPSTLVRCEGRVLPGVERLLDLLSDSGEAALGLLTGNMHAGAKLKLDHYGLYDRFHFGAFGDEHRSRDDVAREAWQIIHDEIDETISSHSVWVLGDTPADVQCARAIGAKALAVTTGYHSREQLVESGPDLLVDDLLDAEAIVSSMLR